MTGDARAARGTGLVVVVMGISGAGKTTVGSALASALGWPFVDADDHHPDENKAMMAAGQPLGEAQREPWLRALGHLVAGTVREGACAVLACSALRERYRTLLRPEGVAHDAVRFVYLRVTPATLAERLATREGHFAGPAILPSQLATLEEPRLGEGTMVVDGERPVEALVAELAPLARGWAR